MNSGNGTSGSTGWDAAGRLRIYLEHITNKDGTEDDADLRKLTIKKVNYGPKGREIVVRWLHGVFVVEGGANISTMAANGNAERTFLDLLAAYEGEGRRVNATSGKSYAPAAFAQDKRSGNLTNRALTDAMNRLFEQGRIHNEESGPPSKRRSHLVIVTGGEE
jgi:RecA-family ATPase